MYKVLFYLGGNMNKLTSVEVNSVVSYIGGQGGHLGDFSYATHAAFYPNYCGLDIDPDQLTGTTRNRFIKILTDAPADQQAKILQGVLEKFPLDHFEHLLHFESISDYEYNQKIKLHEKITKWASELKQETIINVGELEHDFKHVKELLEQAETLIVNHSHQSAVDRAHTALHGYLKGVCKDAGLSFTDSNVGMSEMWAKIKQDHPAFKIKVEEHYKPINQIVNAVSKLLHNLNDIRNKQTFSHPNEEMIGESEAKLVINLSRIFLQYIDNKLTEQGEKLDG
jgi:hypothetical protein